MVVYWKFLGSIGKFRETSCFQNVPGRVCENAKHGLGGGKEEIMEWENMVRKQQKMDGRPESSQN